MAQPVQMPRQGLSVETCVLTEWKKEEGDQIQEGDILFSYETDKANFECESENEGILLVKFFEAGDEVPVFTNVAVIGEEGEDIEEYKPDSLKEEKEEAVEETEPEKSKKEGAAEVTTAEKVRAAPEEEEDIIKISPRAKNLAQSQEVDFRNAEPTGPEGRIIERDIEKLIEEGPVFTPSARAEVTGGEPVSEVSGTGIGGKVTTSDLEKAGEEPVSEPEFEEVELTNIRKNIAESMYESLQSTAQLTLDTSFDASAILEYRKKIKSRKDELDLENITINDIILYAVSRTLRDHEKLNAHFHNQKLKLFKNVHLGMAVDTERGLMVPHIFKANLKSLNQISREAKKRAQACKEGSINPDYLQGGTFTVTNLGTLDIESFTPVLNPPQTGILGVNTIIQRIKEVDGEYESYPAMKLSLTFDHRAIDGAPAARFLKDLKENLENFTLMLAR